MPTSSTVRTAALVAVCALGAGCTPRGGFYSLHTSLAASSAARSTPASVVVSPTYPAVSPQVDTIAIRPETQCADIDAARQAGEEEDALTLLHLRCGVVMGAMERAFAANGYRVVYWSAIERLTAARQQRRATLGQLCGAAEGRPASEAACLEPAVLEPETVAVELGVDAIVSVHSAELVLATPGVDLRWEHAYFRASPAGEQGPAADVPAGLADAMDSFLAGNEQQLGGSSLPTVAIDASIQFLRTHESIFFYRRLHGASASESLARRFFVRCGKVGASRTSRSYRCDAATPTAGADRRPSRAGASNESRTGEAVDDPTMLVWSRLFDEVASDFALRFREGPAAVATPPEAPAPSTGAPATPGAPAPQPPAQGGQTPSWLQAE